MEEDLSQKPNIFTRIEAAVFDRETAAYRGKTQVMWDAQERYKHEREKAAELRVDERLVNRAVLVGKLKAAMEDKADEDVKVYTELLNDLDRNK